VPELDTIWRRRIALMAVVALAVAIPVTIAIRGGDEGEGQDDAAPSELSDVVGLGEREFDRSLGVELRLPAGWKRKKEGEAVTYRSNDKGVLVAISAPGPAGDADEIHDAAVESIESEYRRAEVQKRGSKQRLGGRPAEIAAISATNPKEGTPIRILVATASGEKRAYLVEVFAAGEDPSTSQVEAQVLLNNLSIEG
jgi:hypothetical protein